jgi:hypothetical protein
VGKHHARLPPCQGQSFFSRPDANATEQYRALHTYRPLRNIGSSIPAKGITSVNGIFHGICYLKIRRATWQDVQLPELLDHYCCYKGRLIPVLQDAQDIHGYLPAEVLEKIFKELTLRHHPKGGKEECP